MWWRVAAGAFVGLVVGALASPGYALWVPLGIAGGYLVDLWSKRRPKGDRELGA